MKPLDALMSDWLGQEIPQTPWDSFSLVENGFAPRAIERLLELGLERSDVGTVILPWRTFERRRAQRKKLSTDESERLLLVL